MEDDGALSESAIAAQDIADTLTLSANSFSRVLRRGLKDAIVDGKGLETVLSRAALSLSNSALSAGLKALTNLIGSGTSSLIGGITSSLMGGLSSPATRPIPFARGGVIGTPATFSMGGGKLGMMGEAGREAVLPLARGPDGRLGVALEGRSTQPSITINVSTPDAQSFRRSEAQMTALFARAVGRGSRGL